MDTTTIVFALAGEVETLAQLISNISPQADAANVEFVTINARNINEYLDLRASIRHAPEEFLNELVADLAEIAHLAGRDVPHPQQEIIIEAVTPESLVGHVRATFGEASLSDEETYDLMIEIRDQASEFVDALFLQLNSEDANSKPA